MKRFFLILKASFFLPVFILYYFVVGSEKGLINADFKRYCEWQSRSFTIFGFCLLFVELREFRSICYKRIGVKRIFISWLWKGQNNLSLACESIGPGLIVQHGYSTVVVAERIGKNFHVNQCVNIVWNQNELPLIGDDVTICCGAIIVGGVKIGNNVIVGAGSVVTKNIPDNCTVVGNPARIVKQNGIRLNKAL